MKDKQISKNQNISKTCLISISIFFFCPFSYVAFNLSHFYVKKNPRSRFFYVDKIYLLLFLFVDKMSTSFLYIIWIENIEFLKIIIIKNKTENVELLIIKWHLKLKGR